MTSIGEIERRLLKSKKTKVPWCGAIAQLGERIVRNDEVVGSIPTSSTNLLNGLATISVISVNPKKATYWTVLDRESLANSESSFQRSALRQRYDLRVNLHRGRNARVTHLTLHRFRSGSRLNQPCRVRSAQASP